MTPERYQQIQQVLQQALELPAEARGAFLERACGGDGPLRCEVESLLVYDDQVPSGFLHEPISPPMRDAACSIDNERNGEADTGTQASHTALEPDHATIPSIDGYEILGLLGRGGMGVVYQARHVGLKRVVALKMIRDAALVEPEVRSRFRREAEAVAKLAHPHVVQIHDIGECKNTPYFALEYCAGGSLAALLRGTPLPTMQAARLVQTLARAIHVAHAAGIVHRDLKPANILLADGELKSADSNQQSAPAEPSLSTVRRLLSTIPKIADFGLAKTLDGAEATAQTASGAIVGTPNYMAPEQASGHSRAIGPAVDIYALGAILYELVTGRPPFRASTTLETLAQILNDEPVPPSRLLSKLPRDLETICLKCLRKEPAKRYTSAEALAQDLGRFLNGEPIKARPVGAAERVVKWCWRRPATAALLAVSVLAAAISGLFLLQQAELRGAAKARQEQTDKESQQVLNRAQGLLDDGWDRHDLPTLKEALAEGQRAADIARNGSASATLLDSTMEFQSKVSVRLQRAQKTRDFLAALLDVSAPRETASYQSDDSGRMTTLTLPSADEQYAAAFQRWGVEVDKTADWEVVARLQKEPAVVVQELIAAIDSWMLVRRAQKQPGQDWRRLYRIVEQLDRSEQGRQLRRLLIDETQPRPEGVAAFWGAGPTWMTLWELSQAKGLRTVIDLQHRLDPATAPVMTVVQMARVSRALGHQAGAEDLLRTALAARPSEVVLLTTLGQVLEEYQPPRLGEAIECYRAARALNSGLGLNLAKALTVHGRAREGEDILRSMVRVQPNNPELHFQLGFAFGTQRKWADSEAACRKTIELQPELFKAHFNLSVALRERKKLPEAVAACRKAIELKPNFPEAYDNLGYCLRLMNHFDEAVVAYRKAIELRPNFPQAYVNIGVVFSEQKIWDEAAAAYRKAIELHPGIAEVYTNLGLVAQAQNKPEEAEVLHRKAIQLKPEHVQAHTNLGVLLHNQGRLNEAAAAHRQAIEIDPSFADAYSNLGTVLFEQQALAEAEAAHRKAIELKPDYAIAYSNLGTVLTEQHRYAEAVWACRKAIELKPDYAEAHNNLADALRVQGKLEEALAACRKAIELKPRYADAFNNLGTVLHSLNKLEEAQAAYLQAIKFKANFPRAYHNLGLNLLDQKKLADAVVAFRKAIELKADYAKAHGHLGVALANQGHLEEAVSADRKAIELAPNDAAWHNNLGCALHKMKKFQEAEVALRKAIELKPDFANSYFNLGNDLADQNKSNEAIAAYRTAIKLKPDYYDAHNNLGSLLWKLNRLDEAVVALRQAIHLHADYPEAHNNLGNALTGQGKLDDAVEAFRKAIKLKTDYAEAYSNLGNTLRIQRKLDEAIAACQKAIELNPDFASPYNNMGYAYLMQRKLDEAEKAGRKAIELAPKFSNAHALLGAALKEKNQFKQSIATLVVAADLLPKDDSRRGQVEQWIWECRRFAALEGRLSAVLEGTEKLASAAEHMELAGLCVRKKLFAAAARFNRDAFLMDPKLVEVVPGNRYDAACFASLAGCGQGSDPKKLSDNECAQWRQQALDWLRADLQWWSKKLDADAENAAVVRQQMQHWRSDPDFVGVRDKAELAKLPDAERMQWQALWDDVAALLQRAAEKR